MAYEDIRFERDGGVAVVTLNRPEQRNAYSSTMGRELGEVEYALTKAEWEARTADDSRERSDRPQA